MKKWILLTALRTAIGAGLILLLWGMFILYPSYSAKKTIRQQIKSTNQATSQIHTAKNALQNLPQIDRVSIRQLHSFSNYADQASAAAKILNKLSIPNDNPKSIFSVTHPKLIQDTNNQIASQTLPQAIKQANADIESAAKLADYQSKISKDLVNVLEYDAAGDTANFSVGSEDTNQRLKLAQRGIDKTIAKLSSLKGQYADKNLSGLISIVESMQKARDVLSQNGNTTTWASQVEQTQQDIIANRKGFWNSQSGGVISKLSRDIGQISRSARQWRILTNEYKVY